MRELISDIFPEKKISAANQAVIDGVASLGEIEEQDSENEFSSFPKQLKVNKQSSHKDEKPKDDSLITFIRDEIGAKYRKPLQPKSQAVKQPSTTSVLDQVGKKRTVKQRDASENKPKVHFANPVSQKAKPTLARTKSQAALPLCGLC